MSNEKEFTMLCGFTDSNGLKHTTYTLKEITGVEQEAISKADVRDNGMKVIHRLLALCVTSIGTLTPKDFGGVAKWEREVIRKLYAGDIDTMIVELRKMSIGEEMSVSHQCPYCKAKLNTTFDLDELEVVPFMGEEEIDFNLPTGYTDKTGKVHKVGVIRLPKGEDREMLMPVARKNVAHAETMLLTRMCKFTGEDSYPIDESVMRSLSLRDRKYLNNLLQENSFGIKTILNLSCSECGEDFSVSLSEVASDFFI